MIKYNNNTIYNWNFDASNIIKVYRNNAIVFYKVSGESPTPEYKVCFAVVDDISQYQETEFEDVYDNATDKWYKLNNLNQYEEYGVYGQGTGSTVTTYKGKLTIDDGYEYEWNGSSWVNLGEVTSSTASLPNVPFTVNYNAKNYNASTKTLAKTSGQLADTDAVVTAGTPTVGDGYLTIASGTRATISGYQTYFNRDSNNPNLTIVSKQLTNGSNCHIFANRDTAYNWMYRPTSTKLNFHGSSQIGGTTTTIQPVTESVRVDSNRTLTFNDYSNNTTSTSSNFTYGSTNNGNVGLFAGYGTSGSEWFVGDFYWIYMSQYTLTDEQIQQVINYNENSTTSEYPKYYSEKSDPLNDLVFTTMEDAQTYAYNNCVYDGMRATIDGDRYYFDSEDENGWVVVPEYYIVEDVTPNQASGWTISGSATYNPDPTYYDDFDLETTSTSYATKIAKVTIFGYESFTYYLRSYNYWNSSYSIVMASNIDELSTDPTSMSYSSNSAITNTNGFAGAAGSAVNLSNYRRITYNNLDKTVEHTFYVVFYGRTYTSYVSNATILIPKEQTNENWEQVTFSASSNVASYQKSLYIDNNNSTSGGTQYWYYRWIVGLPSGSHSSYTIYSNFDYCPNTTSSTFTSVAGEQRQVNFTYDKTSNKDLSIRLTDGNGNVLTPSDTVYYNMTFHNSCGVSNSSSNVTFPRTVNVKVGGNFSFSNSSSRHYIYGYQPPTLGTYYNVDNYQSTFDIVYTKLNDEAVTITYTTYDPSDTEVPAFKTDITYPYNSGTTSSTTLTSFDVPYTYPYDVSQTSDKFSADSQSYTANQAARTISFILYPNNREFATVADMEAYAYAWEGMTVYVGSDKYVYQNGEWVYNPSRLPQGYTEVEYVQHSNDVHPTSNVFWTVPNDGVSGNVYTVDLSLDSSQSGVSRYIQLFGSTYGYCYRQDSGYRYNANVGYMTQINYTNSYTPPYDTKLRYRLEPLKLTVTNTVASTSDTINLSSSRGIGSGGTDFGVFNANMNDSGAYCLKGKIYSILIEDSNGVIKHNYVPCKRDSDNVIGLYDIIGNGFYNPSVLIVTAGPNV